jgi:pimeloyl-ACP methyl ester carboxylesterase
MESHILFHNGKIFFTDEGKGRVVVLIHGFLGSKELWHNTRKELQKFFRVISIDLPGHGKSDCYGYVHSMELLAESVKAVLDKLRLKKYVLIGHSMGGYACLAFADLFPDHLRGFCLFHSTAYADTTEKKNDRNKAIASVKENPLVFIRATIKNLFSQKTQKENEENIKFAIQMAKKASRRGIVNALEGMKDRMARDGFLHFADYPIMMIIGKYDAVLPSNLLLKQSETIKKSHVLYLEHSGHMGFLEETQICIDALKKFIRVCFKKQA